MGEREGAGDVLRGKGGGGHEGVYHVEGDRNYHCEEDFGEKGKMSWIGSLQFLAQQGFN